MTDNINDDVKSALDELKKDFPKAKVIYDANANGGAQVIVEGIDLGHPFTAKTTWFGFEIPYNYPYADIYPHFTAPDLQLVDKNRDSLDKITGLSLRTRQKGEHYFMGRLAMQISRVSSQKSQNLTNASAKLLNVRKWLLSI